MANWPMRARHVATEHSADSQHIPRVELAGEWGWCQLCKDKDTPATRKAVWRNPITGERFNVVVCGECYINCQEVT